MRQLLVVAGHRFRLNRACLALRAFKRVIFMHQSRVKIDAR